MFSNASIYLEKADTAMLNDIIQDWSTSYPSGGVLALVAERSLADVKTLQKVFNRLSYPLAGAVFPELISGSEFKKQGVLLIRFEEMPVHCIISLDDNRDIQQVCRDIANCTKIDSNDEAQAFFMLFDALIPNIASIIDALYLESGDMVHYMGVNAGSETFQPMDCLFDNNRFTGNAILTLFLKNHHGAVVEHCYTNPDTTISATSTTGNRISSIDWRPAFEVYKELAKTYYDVDIDEENFYENAVHFPFGIMRMDGEMLVRIPVAIEEDGSIFCVGEVPENAVLTLLRAVSPGSSQTVDSIVSQLSKQEEDNVICFYCAGRRMHLGDAAHDELALLNNKLGDKKIIGALSLGEIGGSKKGGYPLFHNAALLNIPWK